MWTFSSLHLHCTEIWKEYWLKITLKFANVLEHQYLNSGIVLAELMTWDSDPVQSVLGRFCGWELNGVVPLKVENYDLGVEGFESRWEGYFEMGDQTPICCFVAWGTTVLAQYTSYTGKCSTIASQWLEKLPPANSKHAYISHHHTFNFLVEDGLTYLVVVDEEFGCRHARSRLRSWNPRRTISVTGTKAGELTRKGDLVCI
jgi:hypothetical protein